MTSKYRTDFLEYRQAADAEVLSETELHEQQRHPYHRYHHHVGDQKRTWNNT